jgi:phosphonate C-P lyase system protein PhnG
MSLEMNIDWKHDADLISDLNREDIRTLLPDMTDAEIDRVVEVLPMESVTVIQPPTTGLIMAKVRDCFGIDFFLGEVLITRTAVSYGDRRSQVTLMGNLPKHALVAGVLEAMDKNGETAAIDRAIQACRPAAERIIRARQAEVKLTAATRVQFESMAEEP